MTDQGSKPAEQSLRTLVDSVCDRFESAWKSGEQPVLEDYLEEIGDIHRETMFRELLYLDLAYSQKQGPPPCQQSYRDRFVEFNDVVVEVFASHSAEIY